MTLLGRMWAYFKAHGLAETLTHARQRLRVRHRIWEAYNDFRLGIRTGGYIGLKELGINSDVFNDYAPTPYWILRQVMKRLSIRPGQDVLLDYGCGLGRVVIYAATRPFKRVLGIDLSPQLCLGARENVRRAGKRLKCPSVEILEADATAFPIPDDVTVFVLSSPFIGEPLQKVFENIRRSLESAPRKITVVYIPPSGSFDSALDRCGWVKRQSEFRSQIRSMRGRAVVLYAN